MAKRQITRKARRSAQSDEESPTITAEFFATMGPAREVDPGVIEAAKRSRGRPHVAAPKQVVSVRMRAEAAAAFRALSAEKRAALVNRLEINSLQLRHSGHLKAAKKSKAKPPHMGKSAH